MQVLHNGSAPASQAGCVGSIPITCSKKDGVEKTRHRLFWYSGMLSGNRSRCSHSLRQVGSALRRGFAVFLRKCSRVIVYLPRACRGKYIFHSLTAKYRHPAELMPSPYAASAARRKSGVPICHDMRMANLFNLRGPHKITDFVGHAGRLCRP